MKIPIIKITYSQYLKDLQYELIKLGYRDKVHHYNGESNLILNYSGETNIVYATSSIYTSLSENNMERIEYNKETFLTKARILIQKHIDKERYKDILKSGNRITCRNGKSYLIISKNSILVAINKEGWITLEDLCNESKNWDIICINCPRIDLYENMLVDNHNILWKKEDTKEVSIAEIAEMFGTTPDKLRIKE